MKAQFVYEALNFEKNVNILDKLDLGNPYARMKKYMNAFAKKYKSREGEADAKDQSGKDGKWHRYYVVVSKLPGYPHVFFALSYPTKGPDNIGIRIYEMDIFRAKIGKGDGPSFMRFSSKDLNNVMNWTENQMKHYRD